jgi:hypothetical protein
VAADIARYTFLTEGIEAALAQARAAAGAKDVLVVGGANVARARTWRSLRGHRARHPETTRGVSMGFVTAW